MWVRVPLSVVVFAFLHFHFPSSNEKIPLPIFSRFFPIFLKRGMSQKIIEGCQCTWLIQKLVQCQTASKGDEKRSQRALGLCTKLSAICEISNLPAITEHPMRVTVQCLDCFRMLVLADCLPGLRANIINVQKYTDTLSNNLLCVSALKPSSLISLL